MRLEVENTKDGFLMPLVGKLGDKRETEVGNTEKNEFLEFLEKFYCGRENISYITDEEAQEKALGEKYGL
ncbi:MAG: hypothetical protein ACUVQZ_07665 [Candidatus Caldatribacteriaceae bacterium]